MGTDTGAYKTYYITDDKKVVFEDYYDDAEGRCMKNPNGEYISLAIAIREASEGNIDLSKYLIWSEVDYKNPNFTYIIAQLRDFSFDEAIKEGCKAKVFIEGNRSSALNGYRYKRENAIMVINDLIDLWSNNYYVEYSY